MALTDEQKQDRKLARTLTLAAADLLGEGYDYSAKPLARAAAHIRAGYAPCARMIDEAIAQLRAGLADAGTDATFRAAATRALARLAAVWTVAA